MKSCNNCVWKTSDITVEKLFQCKIKNKHFDYPQLHGMFCSRHTTKIVKANSTRGDSDEH